MCTKCNGTGLLHIPLEDQTGKFKFAIVSQVCDACHGLGKNEA